MIEGEEAQSVFLRKWQNTLLSFFITTIELLINVRNKLIIEGQGPVCPCDSNIYVFNYQVDPPFFDQVKYDPMEQQLLPLRMLSNPWI